jgi:hypothetical protein
MLKKLFLLLYYTFSGVTSHGPSMAARPDSNLERMMRQQPLSYATPQLLGGSELIFWKSIRICGYVSNLLAE